ncbi:MAG: HesB/IscA family protein [Bacteroidia bacterium]
MNDKPFITVTDTAKQHILHLRKEGGYAESHALRVSVEGGGCSGLAYKLNFDNEAQAGDQTIEYNEIKLVVNMKSLLYLVGTELDFTGGLKGEGFHFKNPNASRTCACGESFSV